MCLECTRVARTSDSSVILLSRLPSFRGTENIVEKVSFCTHDCRRFVCRQNAKNQANFDVWPKL